MIPEDIYSKIVRRMPIPCVDLLVEDDQGRVLLIRRAKEPAKGQWWFPGGRIHYRETRIQAAVRKLREECGFETTHMLEVGTYDVLLEIQNDINPRHGVTTLFHVVVNGGRDIALDAQSLDADWRLPEEWLSIGLHSFVQQGLAALRNIKDKCKDGNEKNL